MAMKLLFTVLAFGIFFGEIECAEAQARRGKYPGFALVEFFTAEGCFDCRDASEVARLIDTQAVEKSQRVYVLSFHVDSLNLRGWKDPFAKRVFSERQMNYARKLRGRSASPGTMIVNGTIWSIGSSETSVQALIKRAQKNPAVANVESDLSLSSEDVLKVKYRISGLQALRRPFFRVHLVIAEKRIKRIIADGVNTGHEFTHTNVVRLFESQRVAEVGTGEAHLPLPQPLDLNELTLVVFVQDERTNAILGVQRLELSQTISPKKP